MAKKEKEAAPIPAQPKLEKAASPPPTVLPKDGVSRFNQIEPFLPFSKETWRKLVRDRKAPQPIHVTSRCTVYANHEVHRWLADPVGYTA